MHVPPGAAGGAHPPGAALAPRVAAHAVGVAVALVLAWYVALIPVQVTDSLGNLIDARLQGYAALFSSQLTARGFFRPLLWVQIKAAYDLAGGHYWLAFKAVHTVQLLVTTWLVVRLCAVASWRQAALVPLVLAIVVGMHTFGGTIREAHPVNSFLTVVIAVLAAMRLSTAKPSPAVDAGAVLLLAAASMLVESGLLVAAVFVAGRLVGLQGVSGRGIALVLGVVAAYLLLRFGLTANGVPGLVERSSGFGTRVLDPPELIVRFGDRVWIFYAYNVGASLLTVLLSEPRGGVFELWRRLSVGEDLPVWLLGDVLTSALTTALCVLWLGGALARWRRRTLSGPDRLGLVACAVLLANAVLSFGYTKDVIMSPGGVVFAFVVFAAIHGWSWSGHARWAGVVLVTLVASGWAVRAAAVPVQLTTEAFKTRNDWATVWPWLDEQGIDTSAPGATALVQQLRTEALAMPVPHPSMPVPALVDRP